MHCKTLAGSRGCGIVPLMSKKRTAPMNKSTRGVVLGLGAFEKISAVEGVSLTREMKRDLHSISGPRTSAAERTRFITSKYGKKSA